MGFVANVIRFPAVQNFEHQLRFDKAAETLKVGIFETHCVRVQLFTIIRQRYMYIL